MYILTVAVSVIVVVISTVVVFVTVVGVLQSISSSLLGFLNWHYTYVIVVV
jgi:hypothetical protein